MRKELVLKEEDVKKYLREASDDREKCFLLLYQVFENGAFTNLLLQNVNNFVRAMFYGTVTYSHSIDFLIKHLTGEDVTKMDSVTRNIIRMGVWQLAFSDKVPEHAAVFTTVEIIKKYNVSASGYVNKILHKIIANGRQSLDISQYRDDVKVSLSSEIYGILKKYYGKERAVQIGQAFLKQAKLSIRVNTLNVSRDELIAELERDNVKIIGTGFCDECIYVDMNDVELTELNSFKEGKFFVQNEAAMLASIIAAPSKGNRILDCCSAPGGKSTHMAQIAGDECFIDAVDIKKSRVELINENANRLGLGSVHARLGNALDVNYTGEDFEPYDIVVCDVPCSGLGLLGRKPDIRLTITYSRIEELLPTQQKILDIASQKVRPGGTLIYSTCTLNKRENEMQVSEFLLNHPEFQPDSLKDYLPKRLLLEMSDERVNEACSNGTITLTPDEDNTDGFFIARMVRKKN